MKFRFLVAAGSVVILGSVLAARVFAAAYFCPTWPNNTTLQVYASEVKDAYGLTLDVGYDQNSFEKPVVTWGPFSQGGLTDANTQTNGKVILVLASSGPLPESGQVASIAFTPKGNIVRKELTTVNPQLINNIGARIAAFAACPASVGSGDGSSGGGSDPGGSSGGGGGTDGSTGDGKVNPPGTTVSGSGTVVAGGSSRTISTFNVKDFDESLGTSSGSRTPARVDRSGGADYESPSRGGAAGGGGGTPGSIRSEGRPESKVPDKFVPNKSVLDRFKEFTGERTVAALTALFGARTADGFTQMPPIALADGTSTVTVTLAGDPAAKEEPTFSLVKARLVSLKRSEDGGWTIEARPTKGTVTAAVGVSRSNVVTEYPLVVVPPVAVKTDMSKTEVTEADFTLFLKERGTDKEPGFDLNNDGKRDYVDDYIYTGNFLLVTGGAKSQEAGTKQQEGELKKPGAVPKAKEGGAAPAPSSPRAGEEAPGTPPAPRVVAPEENPDEEPAPAPAVPPSTPQGELPVPAPDAGNEPE